MQAALESPLLPLSLLVFLLSSFTYRHVRIYFARMKADGFRSVT